MHGVADHMDGFTVSNACVAHLCQHAERFLILIHNIGTASQTNCSLQCVP